MKIYRPSQGRPMRFFTSDTHFGHKAVIDFCNRPFKDVEHMNEQLIERWDLLVREQDIVYHLGDFSFMNSTKTKEIVSRLRGRIILVQGNHDNKPHRFFKEIFQSFTELLDGQQIEMSHYPYKGVDCNDKRDFSEMQLEDKGNWLLHGHVHCLWKQNGRMINVGVDRWNYAPVSEQEIIDLISGEAGPVPSNKQTSLKPLMS